MKPSSKQGNKQREGEEDPRMQKQFAKEITVRRGRVKAWLDFFVQNNPLYADIVIDPDALS
ncbi:hypothetical protein CLAFUW4_06442 [Fulvia fulva]|uniref:DUF6570 domain-containing protein n=1 Tax=Passalora fulva TaxID=5499 RepID=A0A9Q8LGY3_PASFU|nr:uncharacterized protein CLAFUR5_06585 [Fulvia fulva]KAK4624568.1 hypothetical protein CLAFUR4_06445 [Fulvia fulva]KAK4625917.1 hypothetical protein CLAFUR0_06446 [Fulvia fulva]UJO17185.1 hypothetical protein CLAFUR5_06585 [Fulvia fulva]WPV14444.1 hypothetical protein CLAFUW4_06442 [Fulvia fulva]WPV30157.1 hypothetical protein CLAFUW7_06441 [Fulvia fulva]